jgi:hypothetical protein
MSLQFQAKTEVAGVVLFAWHIYMRGQRFKRLYAETKAHAWEQIIAKQPDVHVIKIVPAPPMEAIIG